MPIGTCDPVTRGQTFNEFDIHRNVEGVGVVRARGEYGWNNVSTKETGCDGPLNSLRVSNFGSVSAYVLLPNKKKGDKWVEIPPGTNDEAISAGQRNQLGVENYSDVVGVTLSATPG